MSNFSLATTCVCVALAFIFLGTGIAAADSVTPFNTVTIDNSDAANVFLSELVFGTVAYSPSSFNYGTTTRFYNNDAAGTSVWAEGDPVPADLVPVAGTSNPKVGDVGSNADNNVWFTTSPDISSLDGIAFQQTIFDAPVQTIFVFERGGNDNGSIQPILLDDTLGGALNLVGGGLPYSLIGNFSGQNDFGYVYTADAPD